MREKILDWLTNFTWFRLLTDRECFCEACGASVGFVVIHGHRRWKCPECSGTGEAAAVAA